jgi:hypothetical protein
MAEQKKPTAEELRRAAKAEKKKQEKRRPRRGGNGNRRFQARTGAIKYEDNYSGYFRFIHDHMAAPNQ